MPLVTDSRGVKFGKTEGNALWLDRNKTSSYELYQYLINLEDCMIIDYLKKLTFLSKEEIEDIERRHKEKPELREAHKILAREVITDLHGEEAYLEAVNISEALFSGNIENFTENDIKDAFKGIEPFKIDKDMSLVDLLIYGGICSSKREAREFISNGSISVNGKKVIDLDLVISKDISLCSKYIIIRRGKKKYYIGVYE